MKKKLLSTLAVAAVLVLAVASPAKADRWRDHGTRAYHERHVVFHRRGPVYVGEPAPVVYAPPVYEEPPVEESPGINLILPIHIH